ncbi:hypothetical protein PAHAL_4G040000 [Panicum hallii]|jgi:hypothetical protein|uniref:Uncharacterized protein n=1 Tax=Panicum hallii TaxID=206008 RepID=A0A2T8JBN6_9POAL|nr:hypothetical protein PAHAL_4G040000 [Panicum hallii]
MSRAGGTKPRDAPASASSAARRARRLPSSLLIQRARRRDVVCVGSRARWVRARRRERGELKRKVGVVTARAGGLRVSTAGQRREQPHGFRGPYPRRRRRGSSRGAGESSKLKGVALPSLV